MTAPGTPIGGGSAKGYQQITMTTLKAVLTVPAGATVAYVVVEGQAMRWRDDGTAPTAAIGMPVPVAGTVTFAGNLAAIQFFPQASGSILDVSYY
jgi:hypothetical protein